MTAREALAALDAAFNAPDSTMSTSEFRQRRDQLVEQQHKEAGGSNNATLAERAAKLGVSPQSLARLDGIFAIIQQNFRDVETSSCVLVRRIAALEKRAAKIEARNAPGIAIHADGVRMDGLAGLGEAVSELRATLASPVVAKYEKGRLVSAVRAVNAPGASGGDVVSEVESRLAQVEHVMQAGKKPHFKFSGGVWRAVAE